MKRYKRPRRKKVAEFRCPYCGRIIFEPNPRFKSRKVILQQFAKKMHQHAVECDKILFLDRSVR